MVIRKLTLTNFRAYTHAEFEFQQGINLLVGVNGVGKTSVLDALRVCLSIIYPQVTQTQQRKLKFVTSDIKIGAELLQVSCDFNYLGFDYTLFIVKQRNKFVVDQKTKKTIRT